MKPTQNALTEYASVVAGIQAQNIEITPEMQRRADQIRGVVPPVDIDYSDSSQHPLTEKQCRMMDKIKAEIKQSKTN